MKSLYNFLNLVCLLLVAASFSACNDDDFTVVDVDSLQKLAAPQVACDGSTVYTLSFSWSGVPGASQYAYRLTDDADKYVGGGVITGLSASFSELNAGSEYSFSVQALPKVYDDVYTASAESVIKASTVPVTQLAAPVVTCVVSGLQCVISWEEVPNADGYYYIYTDGATKSGESSTNDLSVTLKGLSKNEYTFSIYAYSNNEEFSDSETRVVKFSR